MKKLFISLAVLATVASCAKNEPISVAQNNQIGFTTLNNRVTKVANTNDDKTNSSYKVYANITGADSWLINGEVITNEDVIESGSKYYWPATGTVDFYAYAPESTPSTATDASKVELSFTVPDEADTDFTIAAPVKGAEVAVSPVSTEGKVTMTFAHMLSKASLQVKLDEKLANKHTFTFTKAEFNVAKNIVKADAVVGPQTSTVEGETATYAYTCSTTDNITYTASNELFFAPKVSSTGYSIVLTGVSIKNGENVIFSGDLTYDIPEATLFEQGKAYNFIVTINPDATGLILITFASTETSWVDANSNVELSTASKPSVTE